ncbi:MAG TPA: DUF6240 domain-containing protein [Oscillospiraceae bacterium]|nr:DUF6240 domain-containing protein [Oscillospiraceae bacterium]
MNNIRRKDIYRGVIDSYIKMPGRFKIRGTLLKNDGNNIKVDIGSKNTLHITLNKPMDAQVGDNIVIDRRNIVDSKMIRQDESPEEEQETVQDSQDKYDYILKSFDISVSRKSVEAVKSLENHGVDITKENILSFMAAKEQLSNISEKLDYDTAVKLVEKDVDFEQGSLQKVLQEVQKIQGEERPFSLMRFLGIKKDMSTDEAESIAYEIYGNRAGKDITDIIKALDKAGLDTSKENVEQINKTFSKLHDIKNIENKTIIDSVKNKIKTSIDNLYKLKNAVARSTIKAEQKLGQLANKVYSMYDGAVGTITEKELTQIEGDIKDRLQYMGIKITDEVVKLSKDVIGKGLDLTKGNLEKIMAVKGAIIELNSGLDYEKTALLMASGVEVEKVDVAELRDMIDIEYSIESTEYVSMENIDHIPAEHDTGHVTAEPDTGHVTAEPDTRHIPAERGITLGLDRLEILELAESIDIKTLALHMKLDLPTTLEALNLSQQLIDGDIMVDDWLNALSEQLNLDYELSTIEKEEPTQISTGKTEPVQNSMENIKPADEMSQLQSREISNASNDLLIHETEQQVKTDTNIETAENIQTADTDIAADTASIDKAEVLELLGRLANTESRGLDFIVQGYLRLNEDNLGGLLEEKYTTEMTKVIIKSGIPLNNDNMQEMHIAKKTLEQTAENLTIETLQNAVEEGISVEKTDLEGLSDLIKLLSKDKTEQVNKPEIDLENNENVKQDDVKQDEMTEINNLQNEQETTETIKLQNEKESIDTISLENKEDVRQEQETVNLQDEQNTARDVSLQDDEVKQETKQDIEVKDTEQQNAKQDIETKNIEQETKLDTETKNIEQQEIGQDIEQISKEENISLEINRQEIESNKEDVKPDRQNIEPNRQQLEPNTQKAAADRQEIDLNRQQSELNIQGPKIDIQQLELNIQETDIDIRQLELNRQEILNQIENIDMKTLALHIKLDLPTTLENLNLSQQLMDGDITVDDWLNILPEQISEPGQISELEKIPENRQTLEPQQMLESGQISESKQTLEIEIQPNIAGELTIDKAELSEILDKLTNMETTGGLDFTAQNYLRANGDRLGTLAEESYKGEIAKAIIQSGIPLNNDNMQKMYTIKKDLEQTAENLTADILQNAVEEGITVEKDIKVENTSDNIQNAIQDEDIRNVSETVKHKTRELRDIDTADTKHDIEFVDTDGTEITDITAEESSDTESADINHNKYTHVTAEEAAISELNRQEILDSIEKIDMETLALHMKLDIPNTLETLNISQQLIDGEITVDKWLSILNEQLDLEYESAENELFTAEEAGIPQLQSRENTTIESSEIQEAAQQQNRSTGPEQILETETRPDVVGGLLIDKTELLDVLDRLSDAESRGLDPIAQGYLRMNSDKLGTLTEENYKGEIAKAVIRSGIPLNNNNVQEMYKLKRTLDGTIENLTPEIFQNMAEKGMLTEKLNLNELFDITNHLGRDEVKYGTQTKNVSDGTEGVFLNAKDKDVFKNAEDIVQNRETEVVPGYNGHIEQNEEDRDILANAGGIEEIADKVKSMVDILKQIPPERKNTIISLLMRNAMPLTLKEVQNLSFFLNNRKQIGHQLDEILNLIDKNNNVEIIEIAEELKKAVNKINGHIKEGRQIEEKPYEEFLRLLKTLEDKSSFLTKEDREAFQKSGEKLLDSLELQLQLNREDTVLQLPLMMSEYIKNLQIYIVRDKKGRKKIDPKKMSILLNFDTNNMGNINIYVAVNYKNVVMKMGLADEKDRNLVEKCSDKLEKHLKDLGYDLKDLSFRISDDNHILSMTDEIEGNNPRIKRLLDVRI